MTCRARDVWFERARGSLFVGTLVCAVSLIACKKPSGEKPAPPATITGKRPEGEIARVTLTQQAEERLGVVVATAERRPSPRSRTVGGDVVPSSGRAFVVVAPIAGRLSAAGGGELRAGQTLRRGDPVLRLTPVASVDRDLRATADRSVAVAESRLTAAEARLARSEKLLVDGAGAARSGRGEGRARRGEGRSGRSQEPCRNAGARTAGGRRRRHAAGPGGRNRSLGERGIEHTRPGRSPALRARRDGSPLGEGQCLRR
jgi:hypothetical protein